MPELPMRPEGAAPECISIHELAEEAHHRGENDLAAVLFVVCGAVAFGSIHELAAYLKVFATNQINAIDALQRRN